ncbi:methylated-DNA--[protein]-cysteine S-methyltransferase [Streptomyces sp. XM4193]|uniref:methylated-DNA--[protein]-cysteine S-methyltransferase n=1 Tax=Streptomyces sp. XM4193 TaxID=2929782 RepID=UPI001FF9CBF2|nr:methylated-DNA--[protein]-cysteine S-methyltransferase [Streptomyces sp. XM4193]MCK1798303.1 methylated-DNA--[protein]-cysteine S-methyltransferase [Streptomyces sp. XM4193]
MSTTAAPAATAGPGGPARRTHTVVESPIGPLTLVATDGVLCGLYMEDQRHLPARETFGAPDPDGFDPVAQQLAEYFAGERTEFTVPLTMEGTEFRRTVWTALRDIPYGRTESYGELAARIGRPSASRAVGMANGRNPISIIVPCHRVIAGNGNLTGYGGGLPRKRHLLALESDRTAAR